MTQYKMLSDEFVKEHRALIGKHAGTIFAKDHRGAFDVVSRELKRKLARDEKMTPYTPYTKSMSNTRGDEFQPDPATVQALLEHVRSEWGDDSANQYAAALNEKWPGICGGEEDESEDIADLDEPPANPNPERSYEGQGTEGFSEDDDFPESSGKQVGGPNPFKGMPERGGRMAGDSAFHRPFRMPPAELFRSLP